MRDERLQADKRLQEAEEELGRAARLLGGWLAGALIFSALWVLLRTRFEPFDPLMLVQASAAYLLLAVLVWLVASAVRASAPHLVPLFKARLRRNGAATSAGRPTRP